MGEKMGLGRGCLLECVCFLCVLAGLVMSVGPGVDKDGVVVGPQSSFWFHWVLGLWNWGCFLSREHLVKMIVSPALPRNSNGRLDFPGRTQEEA